MAGGEKTQTTQFSEGFAGDGTNTLEKDLADDMAGTGAAWIHIVTDLADNTGMHGLGNIRRHGSIVKKLFWIVVLLTSLGKFRYSEIL